MKLTSKWTLSRAKSRLRKWMHDVSEEEKASLTAYAQDFTRMAVKFTPPGNNRISPGKALRNLKERIRRDFEGDTGKESALTDDDITWRTDHGGQHYALLPNGKHASPFRAVRGRVTDKKLRALNLGRYHVEFTGENLAGFMRGRDEYRWRKGRGGSAVRMVWRGARHLAPERSIKAEIRRRQFLVGRLLAGWKPVARKARTKLPAAAERQSGNGTVSIRKDGTHGAVLTATNKGNFPELQAIINRNLQPLQKRIRNTARKRQKMLANKMKKS